MAEKQLTNGVMEKCLDWAYDKAVNGIPGFDSAQELAEDYMTESDSLRECANALIRWQNSKSAISGFATGFGGFATMLATLPANITSVLYIQIRMIAAIAVMGGYDLKDDRVKTMVYACLVCSSGAEVLKSVGIKIGQRAAIEAIKGISRETIKKINQKTIPKLVTKFGSKGIINLGKAVPVLGGIIGGAFDAFSTNVVGNVARDAFLPENKIGDR
jgi:hypothetical protein